MHWLRSKSLLTVGAALSIAATLAVQPLVGAQAPTAQTGSQAAQKVILVLSAPCPAPSAAPSGTCPAQAPVLAELSSIGAPVLSSTTLVDTITTVLTPDEQEAFSTNPAISQVVPDSIVQILPPVQLAAGPGSSSTSSGPPGWRSHGPTPTTACGTQKDPELDPEALQEIYAPQAQALGFDGAGVTVAFIADGLDPTNPDFQRNPAYGTPGKAVIAQYQDFSGDGTDAPTSGGEAFGDASSIAAQGNEEYNLAQFVNPAQAARLPATGCWIRIVGAAPGANVMALKAFPQSDDETASGIIQAIQYAVQNGAKVINESFGSDAFPDTSLDVLRDADDAAVAAGVTVVVSTGDGGSTSTTGSPATDPEMISVGATTTFRGYAQANFGGFDNPAVGNGRWADNNISALSSGGFNQSGTTLDLVAPGDLNWALCSTDTAMYSDCADTWGGTDNGIQLFGGTSEAAPLTAAAAADVIQAYAQTHGGTDPSPALVKQILMSSATDIDAPADEQGAGLLNVLGAVKLAESLPGATSGYSHRPQPKLGGGLLVSPGQVNIVASPNTPESQQISLTNTGPGYATVELSTRALTDKVYDSGVQSFTMDPTPPTTNSGALQIWSGVTEVYQTETFFVPPTYPTVSSRLIFSADYQYTEQTSVLHFALFEPDGTYAGYSQPQGFGDYGEVEVANPPAGTWTALFFTEQNGTGGVGTSGPVQWDASLWRYVPAGSISPSFLIVPPGQTATAMLTLSTPANPGDTDQSIVVSSGSGQTTIPVTVRSTVPLGVEGGTFTGVLTGGNGREATQAQTNTYFFQVPPGETDLDASVALATDPGEELIALLVDPGGQTVGYSSNYTFVPHDGSLAPGATEDAQLYHVAPEAGQWELILDWQNPVTGDELAEPFTGAIEFNEVSVEGDLPDSPSTTLTPGSTSFDVTVDNTGVAPEAFFADPRLDQTATYTLENQNPAIGASDFSLPLAAGLSFPLYIVPTHTTQLNANVTLLSGTTPVSFDMEYFPGDPDVSPAVPAPGVTGTTTSSSASLTLTGQPELSPGLWLVNPDEVGPYPVTGAPTETAIASLSAVTQAFDPAVATSTDDFWQLGFGASNFLYLLPGESGDISVSITPPPTASAGTVVTGTLYVDDYVLASLFAAPLPDGDELAAIPYSYTVG